MVWFIAQFQIQKPNPTGMKFNLGLSALELRRQRANGQIDEPRSNRALEMTLTRSM